MSVISIFAEGSRPALRISGHLQTVLAKSAALQQCQSYFPRYLASQCSPGSLLGERDDSTELDTEKLKTVGWVRGVPRYEIHKRKGERYFADPHELAKRAEQLDAVHEKIRKAMMNHPVLEEERLNDKKLAEGTSLGKKIQGPDPLLNHAHGKLAKTLPWWKQEEQQWQRSVSGVDADALRPREIPKDLQGKALYKKLSLDERRLRFVFQDVRTALRGHPTLTQAQNVNIVMEMQRGLIDHSAERLQQYLTRLSDAEQRDELERHFSIVMTRMLRKCKPTSSLDFLKYRFDQSMHKKFVSFSQKPQPQKSNLSKREKLLLKMFSKAQQRLINLVKTTHNIEHELAILERRKGVERTAHVLKEVSTTSSGVEPEQSYRNLLNGADASGYSGEFCEADNANGEVVAAEEDATNVYGIVKEDTIPNETVEKNIRSILDENLNQKAAIRPHSCPTNATVTQSFLQSATRPTASSHTMSQSPVFQRTLASFVAPSNPPADGSDENPPIPASKSHPTKAKATDSRHNSSGPLPHSTFSGYQAQKSSPKPHRSTGSPHSLLAPQPRCLEDGSSSLLQPQWNRNIKQDLDVKSIYRYKSRKINSVELNDDENYDPIVPTAVAVPTHGSPIGRSRSPLASSVFDISMSQNTDNTTTESFCGSGTETASAAPSIGTAKASGNSIGTAKSSENSMRSSEKLQSPIRNHRLREWSRAQEQAERILGKSLDDLVNPQMDKLADFGYKKVPRKQKQGLVGNVFSSVASKYDIMNDVMSMGVHRLWKNHFVNRLATGLENGMNVLDVAGGTGDIAFRLLNRAALKGDHETKVTVADINPDMLKYGKKRAQSEMEQFLREGHLNFIEQNAEVLGAIPDSSVDLYTICFGIRNCTNIQAVLHQAFRVLKPGGVFACMEFSKVNPLLAPMYRKYSFRLIPLMGTVVAGDCESYQYLVESIDKFPDQNAFEKMIRHAGFKTTRPHGYENLTFGIAAIHTGLKPLNSDMETRY